MNSDPYPLSLSNTWKIHSCVDDVVGTRCLSTQIDSYEDIWKCSFVHYDAMKSQTIVKQRFDSWKAYLRLTCTFFQVFFFGVSLFITVSLLGTSIRIILVHVYFFFWWSLTLESNRQLTFVMHGTIQMSYTTACVLQETYQGSTRAMCSNQPIFVPSETNKMYPVFALSKSDGVTIFQIHIKNQFEWKKIPVKTYL